MKLPHLLFAALLLLTAGCQPNYQNKINPTAEEKVDLKPYVGVWKLTKMFGRKVPVPGGDEAYFSTKIQGDQLKILGSKKLDFSKPETTLQPKYAQLVRLGNAVIAFEPSGKQWILARLRFAPEKKQLIVDLLNDVELKKEIESGKLKGTAVYNDFGRYTKIRVTASEKELRTYLSQKAQFNEMFVLTRISG